jgi:hypothetical protein
MRKLPAKAKNIPTVKAAQEGADDNWTWTAIEADFKQILSIFKLTHYPKAPTLARGWGFPDTPPRKFRSSTPSGASGV